MLVAAEKMEEREVCFKAALPHASPCTLSFFLVSVHVSVLDLTPPLLPEGTCRPS